MRSALVIVFAAVTACGMALAAADAPKLPDGYKLLYEQAFKDEAAAKDFVFSDPAMWQLSTHEGRLVLDWAGVTAQSTRKMKCQYSPKVRSPNIIGLVGGKQFGDFVL